MQENMDLRLFAKGSGVPMWKIAQYMGISEPTLTRKWRIELNDEEKNHYRTIIEKIKKEERQ